MMRITPPVVKAQMLIRRPVTNVFEAFLDPDVTRRFWFTRATGRLEEGHRVEWFWDMYGVSTVVDVKVIEPNSRILIEWDDPPCPVEWTFDARDNESTLVQIVNRGFRGTDDEVVSQAIDAMGGFSLVLAGLKAYLEHGIELNLVADHHPARVDGET